jgi:hypothetical protein
MDCYPRLVLFPHGWAFSLQPINGVQDKDSLSSSHRLAI